MSTQELADQLAAAEAPVADAIVQTIHAWPAAADSLRSLPGAALFFLRLRIETSLQFVLLLVDCPSPEEGSLFAFPSGMDRVEVARFLLIDWWEQHGRLSAAMAMISDFHDGVVEDNA